eukprot:3215028-Rhodomonas_salina.1
MALLPGEVVTFHLPEFFRSSTTTVRQFLCLEQECRKITAGTWTRASRELQLTVLFPIAAGEIVPFVVPASLGLRLPEEGVSDEKAKFLTISTNAMAGPVPPTSIRNVQTFG